jgi:hypothetical protein
MEGQNLCAHCEEPLLGEYCHQCGQKKIASRFTLRRISSDALSSITNLEKGFLATFKEMIIAPGRLINNYLSGDTVNTFRPFRYALIWATVSAVLSIWIGVFDVQQSQMQGLMGVDLSPEDLARQQKIQEGIRNFMNFLILAVLPFSSAISLLLFRKHKKNYAEHLVINTFILGQVTALSLFLYPFYFFVENAVTWAFLAGSTLNIFYYGYAYARVFRESFLRSLLKSIGVQVLSFILVMIAAMVGGAVVAIVMIFLQKAFS